MAKVKRIERVIEQLDEINNVYDSDLNSVLYELWRRTTRVKNKEVYQIIKSINKAANDAENALMVLDSAKQDLENYVSDK